MDCLTDEIRKQAPWQTMFADDIVKCTCDWGKLDEDLEMWKEVGISCAEKESEGNLKTLSNQLSEVLKGVQVPWECDKQRRRIRCGSKAEECSLDGIAEKCQGYCVTEEHHQDLKDRFTKW